MPFEYALIMAGGSQINHRESHQQQEYNNLYKKGGKNNIMSHEIIPSNLICSLMSNQHLLSVTDYIILFPKSRDHMAINHQAVWSLSICDHYYDTSKGQNIVVLQNVLKVRLAEKGEC